VKAQTQNPNNEGCVLYSKKVEHVSAKLHGTQTPGHCGGDKLTKQSKPMDHWGRPESQQEPIAHEGFQTSRASIMSMFLVIPIEGQRHPKVNHLLNTLDFCNTGRDPGLTVT
jgi:hypothetical protein